MLSPLLSPWPLHQMTFANSDTAIKYAYAVLVPSVNTINNPMLPFACECVYLSNDELIGNERCTKNPLDGDGNTGFRKLSFPCNSMAAGKFRGLTCS